MAAQSRSSSSRRRIAIYSTARSRGARIVTTLEADGPSVDKYEAGVVSSAWCRSGRSRPCGDDRSAARFLIPWLRLLAPRRRDSARRDVENKTSWQIVTSYLFSCSSPPAICGGVASPLVQIALRYGEILCSGLRSASRFIGTRYSGASRAVRPYERCSAICEVRLTTRGATSAARGTIRMLAQKFRHLPRA